MSEEVRESLVGVRLMVLPVGEDAVFAFPCAC